VVQDTFARALVALDELQQAPSLHLAVPHRPQPRGGSGAQPRDRAAEPIEAAPQVADQESPDPVEVLMRREAVDTAVSRFAKLPTGQRSVVILEDVLNSPWRRSPALLGLTVNAVTSPAGGHGDRARVGLEEDEARAVPCEGWRSSARPARRRRRATP
jgi:hypothetical protein